MSARAVMKYLDFKFKEAAQNTMFQSAIGDTLAGLGGSQGAYSKALQELWHGKQKPERKKSAEEIIAETFKKHNIKIKEEAQ